MKKNEHSFYEGAFKLSPVLPFRLDLTVWTLRRRFKNKIDVWDGTTYTRVLIYKGVAIQTKIKQVNDILEVTLKSSYSLKDAQSAIMKILRDMLGVDINLKQFYNLSRNDIHLQTVANNFLGVKPPRFPSIFEALINAISCQQVTLDLGILLMNRLAETFGQRFIDKNYIQYAFPNPHDLIDASEDKIKKLGFSYQKARAIKNLATLLNVNKTIFLNLKNLKDEEIRLLLSSLRGIGRWSSEYVLLRGLGRLNIFPGDDVGAQKNIQQLFSLTNRPHYEEIKKLTMKWQPYAGLVYFHLLLDKLEKKRLI